MSWNLHQLLGLNSSLINLEPTNSKKNPVDFTYPGSKGNPDPFILDKVWEMLNSDQSYDRFFDGKTREYFSAILDLVKASIKKSSIPYHRLPNRVRYFTFGGLLVNRAIALYQDHYDFEADNISLTVKSPILWDQLSDQPQDYEMIYPKLFDKYTAQSIFQTLLPLSLQLDEYLQYWIKDVSTRYILNRLKNSTPIELNHTVVTVLGLA